MKPLALLLTLTVSHAEPVTSEPPVFAESMFVENAEWQKIGGGYAGCEGAQWIVENGEPVLLYAAQHDFLAFKWSEKTGLTTWRDDSPEATSFRPDGKGGYYVVEQQSRRVVRWNGEAEVTEVLAETFEGKKLNRPNDAVIAPDGALWFTDPDFLFAKRKDEKKEQPGQFVFRLDLETKELTAPIRNLGKPNGIAFSPDGKFLYVSDSASPNLYRWSTGDFSKRKTFAKFKEKGLDGLAFDREGNLWCATNSGIRIMDSAGKQLALLKTPNKPTSIAFSPAPHDLVCVTVRDACYIIGTRTLVRPTDPNAAD